MPATLPGPPFQPTISALSSTSISLEWSFDDATYNGGTPIIDYKVYYDNGVSGQTLLMAGTTSLLTAYTTPSGSITPGTTYTFWISALNYVGEGAQSPKKSVTAASVPSIPATPTVSATYNSVIVNWISPAANGSVITGY